MALVNPALPAVRRIPRSTVYLLETEVVYEGATLEDQNCYGGRLNDLESVEINEKEGYTYSSSIPSHGSADP